MPSYVSPKFLVTDVKHVGDIAPAQSYTDATDLSDSWKVSMLHGYYKDTKLELFFDNEVQANRFSQWQLYEPFQVIDNIGSPNEGMIVKATQSFRSFTKRNPYTDRPIEQQMWRVLISNSRQDRQIQITTPAPQRTSVSQLQGGTITTQDLFGTMDAMPAAVASQLDALAAAASDAQQQMMEAQAAADAAAAASAANAAQLQSENAAAAVATNAMLEAQLALWEASGLPAPIIDQVAANTQQWLNTGNQTIAQYQAAAAAASLAQAQLNLQLASNAAQANYRLHATSHPTTDHLYQITRGGGTGYYNEIYFAAGTFADPQHPYNGQWYGTFIPVINGQAIPWMTGATNTSLVHY